MRTLPPDTTSRGGWQPYPITSLDIAQSSLWALQDERQLPDLACGRYFPYRVLSP